MSDTWYLRDARGNVVGPISREVAVDLLRSRPGVFLFSSRDGGEWQAVRAPPIQTMVATEDPVARRGRETQEALRAELELDRLRELEPWNLFGVPKEATLKDYRKGFLTLAKRYHPARLPKDVSPVLLRSNMAVYQYLTEVMHRLEQSLGGEASPPQPSAPRPSGPTAARAPRSGTLPTWQLAALKLRGDPNLLRGSFSVTRDTAFVFSVHRLMNLSNESVFFPCLPALSLGTRLDLSFQFEEAARTILSTGKVAFESSGGSAPRGFGVRLALRTEEKGFMLRESQRLMTR